MMYDAEAEKRRHTACTRRKTLMPTAQIPQLLVFARDFQAGVCVCVCVCMYVCVCVYVCMVYVCMYV